MAVGSPEENRIRLEGLLRQRVLAGRPAAGNFVDLPLAPVQAGLWILDRLQPDDTAYIMPLVHRFPDGLDPRAAVRCLRELTRRHLTLRTVFPQVAGKPVQRVMPQVAFDVPVRDLGELPEDAFRAAVLESLDELTAEPFDLAAGPLFRAALVRGAGRLELALAIHHIVFDGRSIEVLHTELDQLSGTDDALPELPLSYADWAVQQCASLDSGETEEEVRWWREYLECAPAQLDLPSSLPAPVRRDGRGARHGSTLPVDVWQRLTAMGARDGLTPFLVLLAGMYALLRRAARQPDLTVGVPVANRERSELQGLIGYFVNTVPIRMKAASEGSFRALLCAVRDAALNVYGHQALPFAKLVEKVRPDRDPSRHPIFQVMVALQTAEAAPSSIPDLQFRPDPPRLRTKFDLTVNSVERDGALQLVWEYATDRFAASEIALLADSFTKLMHAVCTTPERPVGDFALEELDRWANLDTVAVAVDTGVEDEAAPADVVARVSEIWKEALGVPSVGDEDGFFELGGTSLTAVAAMIAIREEFGVELPLRQLFVHPTPAGIALAIQRERCEGIR